MNRDEYQKMLDKIVHDRVVTEHEKRALARVIRNAIMKLEEIEREVLVLGNELREGRIKDAEITQSYLKSAIKNQLNKFNEAV